MLLIFNLGGWLIMMGQHSRSESLFYYFGIEDQVPENHLLRLLDRHIDFDFVREKLQDSYSDTGRPSIDSELLLRILLIGYLRVNRSERLRSCGPERTLPHPLRVQVYPAALALLLFVRQQSLPFPRLLPTLRW
jgi:hypothetical protein